MVQVSALQGEEARWYRAKWDACHRPNVGATWPEQGFPPGRSPRLTAPVAGAVGREPEIRPDDSGDRARRDQMSLSAGEAWVCCVSIMYASSSRTWTP